MCDRLIVRQSIPLQSSLSSDQHLALELQDESAAIDGLAELFLVSSDLDSVDLGVFAKLICVLDLSQAEKLAVDLALTSPLHFLVVRK